MPVNMEPCVISKVKNVPKEEPQRQQVSKTKGRNSICYPRATTVRSRLEYCVAYCIMMLYCRLVPVQYFILLCRSRNCVVVATVFSVRAVAMLAVQ